MFLLFKGVGNSRFSFFYFSFFSLFFPFCLLNLHVFQFFSTILFCCVNFVLYRFAYDTSNILYSWSFLTPKLLSKHCFEGILPWAPSDPRLLLYFVGFRVCVCMFFLCFFSVYAFRACFFLIYVGHNLFAIQKKINCKCVFSVASMVVTIATEIFQLQMRLQLRFFFEL